MYITKSGERGFQKTGKMNKRPVLIILGGLASAALLLGILRAVQVKRDAQGPWPKCVGMTGEDCRDMISQMAPSLNIYIIPDGSAVTMDYRLDRVRIFIDDDDVVVSVPDRG